MIFESLITQLIMQIMKNGLQHSVLLMDIVITN